MKAVKSQSKQKRGANKS